MNFLFDRKNIKSIQRGTIAATSSGATTATISSVDTTKSMVVDLGNTGTTSLADPGMGPGMLQLTNATTVTLTKANHKSGTTTTYSFEVIEYY